MKKKINEVIIQGRLFKYTIDKNGCWNAVDCSVDKDGYPRISYAKDKKSTIARFIYQVIYGWLEPGQVARHTCDNCKCINPAHIIPGTQQDNIRDRQERGRGQYGEKNGRAKLTEKDVRHIRKEQGKVSAKTLAEEYGVRQEAIRDIWSRKLWKHVA